jgi:hypothetical protein
MSFLFALAKIFTTQGHREIKNLDWPPEEGHQPGT